MTEQGRIELGMGRIERVSDVTERLTDVFRTTFGDETIVLAPDMTADDIEAWDSASHITLIYAIEDEFGIKFSTRDLENLGCVGDLIAVITRRL
jgi:acyl carrier protein